MTMSVASSPDLAGSGWVGAGAGAEIDIEEIRR
jgi:hypothetical protein